MPITELNCCREMDGGECPVMSSKPSEPQQWTYFVKTVEQCKEVSTGRSQINLIMPAGMIYWRARFWDVGRKLLVTEMLLSSAAECSRQTRNPATERIEIFVDSYVPHRSNEVFYPCQHIRPEDYTQKVVNVLRSFWRGGAWPNEHSGDRAKK